MRRWLPNPLVSLVLFLAWLMLAMSADPANLLLAAALAVAIPLATRRLAPEPARIARPAAIVRLGLVVLFDIVVANLEVARLILGPESAIRPRFVWVPLTVRDPNAIAALAGIVTMTPGTLSSDLSPDRRYLLVHAFNAPDEAALVAQIKARYEAPLLEIYR
jgi:multicomponent K+:H+ antiporter subunit E